MTKHVTQPTANFKTERLTVDRLTQSKASKGDLFALTLPYYCYRSLTSYTFLTDLRRDLIRFLSAGVHMEKVGKQDELSLWLNLVPFSKPRKNIPRDFSDGGKMHK